ncbi:hypothetical protein T492DRAFT_1002468 [Pavlovales sp. CCMP2436]|nr:hypothetical protein T492DRAFT_1002468 [Pavlovales sp. CCMP2436]
MEAAIMAAIANAGSAEALDAAYDDKADTMIVYLDDLAADELFDVEEGRLRAQCDALLAAAERVGWGLNVRLTTDDEIRFLNRVHRGKDMPTDILSFSSDSGGMLGDLAISLPYVARSIVADAQLSAEERAADRARGGAYGRLVDEQTVARRLPLLIVHGICHLLGHDHEDDGDHVRMLALEEAILQAASGHID